jgi:hypothetical protein
MTKPTAMRKWLECLLIIIAAVILYSINLDKLPHNDELYHMLAAQGWLESGLPSIGEGGRYWRGYPFTWLVAQSIDVLGGGLVAGRLPAVLFMACTVGVLFAFLRHEAGAAAAWVGAGLFAVSPFAIDLAQFVRFYSLQCLVFLAGACLVYRLLTIRWVMRRDLPIALLAAGLLAFAVYLQITSLIGLVGLGLWGGATLLLPWLARREVPTTRKLGLVLLLAALGAVGLLGLRGSGQLEGLIHDYRATALFNRHLANDFWFYFSWYFIYYPVLWILCGIIAVFALIEQPRLTIFALVMFIVAFVLNSFAGAKSLRYIAYAQPFLFMLWGTGLTGLLARMRGLLGTLESELTDRLGLLSRGLARGIARLLIAGALLIAIMGNPAWLRSFAMLADITLPQQIQPTDWPAAEPALRPWLDSVEVFVATEELGPLYYYGRTDILLSATKFDEIGGDRRPFDRDPRTDVPTIKAAADLEDVIDCHASGLFLTQAKHWGLGARLRDPAVEALVSSRAEPIELPARTGLMAFGWRHEPPPANRSAACARLP